MATAPQKREVICENRALKSFVGVPVPSGFDARSNALNLDSSNCNACSQESKLNATKVMCNRCSGKKKR